MHPAPSIIVFTTLSGIGFGLMAWLGLGLGPEGFWFAFLACGLALGFACIGLIASLWHLGNPQRAWRALSQWRSSWLSREGVASIATLTVFGLYALLWVVFGLRTPWLGLPAAVLSVVSIVCTSMIYGLPEIGAALVEAADLTTVRGVGARRRCAGRGRARPPLRPRGSGADMARRHHGARRHRRLACLEPQGARHAA